MIAGGLSDIGTQRDNNEDSFYISDVNSLNLDYELNLFIVADGMGGHNAGEVASNMAIRTISERFESIYKNIEKNDENIVDFIRDGIIKANNIVYEESCKNVNKTGMGTTLTLLLVDNDKYYIGHIGDSRIYLIRNNTIRQLSNDHSLVAELIRNGSITENEAKVHPQKNVITRALGTEESVEVDIIICEKQDGDKLLLCTDGLTNMLNNEEILNIVMKYEPQKACTELIKQANLNGGFDNITAIVVNI